MYLDLRLNVLLGPSTVLIVLDLNFQILAAILVTYGGSLARLDMLLLCVRVFVLAYRLLCAIPERGVGPGRQPWNHHTIFLTLFSQVVWGVRTWLGHPYLRVCRHIVWLILKQNVMERILAPLSSDVKHLIKRSDLVFGCGLFYLNKCERLVRGQQVNARTLGTYLMGGRWPRQGLLGKLDRSLFGQSHLLNFLSFQEGNKKVFDRS
jgi:hypothetical protein